VTGNEPSAAPAAKTLTVPNVLCLLRLLSAPVLLCLAWAGTRPWFLALLVAALATDAVDGRIARRTGQKSVLGARLDSVADFTLYSCLAFSVWLLWPRVVLAEFPVVVAAVLGYVTPVVVGLLRYGRLTSYHTRAARLSAVLMAVSVVLLLAGGSPWPFRVATPVMVLAGIEEIGITLTLRRWRADVPSLGHALRLQREEAAEARRGVGGQGDC
jgi:CDP-diacylglycerol--glycerol-3-phosphate 3-phosphatidyltransferase